MKYQISQGSLKDFLRVARLSEQNDDFSNQDNNIQTMLQDHESLILWLRKDITNISDELQGPGTADFMTGLMERHEKMEWMLRSYLE